jgi:hypothetical protein
VVLIAFAVRAGVLWLGLPSRDLTPESLRDPTCVGLTLGITRDVLHGASCGLHRFEPVAGAVLPPSWAMLLTRQGISLADLSLVKPIT